MGKDRLTLNNMARFGKSQLKPCNNCDLSPDICGKQYGIDVPKKDTSVMCIKFGAVEIIDLSELDRVIKISIPRNGEHKTDTKVPAAEAAGL